MRTITKEIYSVDELSDEAKEKAHREYLNKGFEYFWMDEAMESLKIFCAEFNIVLRNWSIDSQRVDVDARFEISENIEKLSGVRLATWIINNHWTDLFRRKYLGHAKGKSRYSRCQWGEACPTGYCMDYSIRKPLWDFLKKPSNTDLESLLRECVYSWEADLKSDLEHQESLEYFVEHAEANNYEFEEDGSFY